MLKCLVVWPYLRLYWYVCFGNVTADRTDTSNLSRCLKVYCASQLFNFVFVWPHSDRSLDSPPCTFLNNEAARKSVVDLINNIRDCNRELGNFLLWWLGHINSKAWFLKMSFLRGSIFQAKFLMMKTTLWRTLVILWSVDMDSSQAVYIRDKVQGYNVSVNFDDQPVTKKLNSMAASYLLSV